MKMNFKNENGHKHGNGTDINTGTITDADIYMDIVAYVMGWGQPTCQEEWKMCRMKK
jgi:hypothetical protein